MRKAFTIGIATGIILSLLLIGAIYVKPLLPSGNVLTELAFLFALFILVAMTLWISMNFYCRSAAVQWGSLNFTGLTASFIAALLVSIAGFVYTTYIHPNYLSEVLHASQQKWAGDNYSPGAIASQLEWSWFDSPLNFALFNFQTTIVVLCLITLIIATIYYVRNRNRISGHNNANNHELIF